MSVVFSIYSFSLVNVICVFHCLISNLFLFENSLDVHSDSRFISIILILYDQKSSNFNLELSVQMKTEIVALVLCLNIGVDPPDVLKVSPCARLECWIGNIIKHNLIQHNKTCMVSVFHLNDFPFITSFS